MATGAACMQPPCEAPWLQILQFLLHIHQDKEPKTSLEFLHFNKSHIDLGVAASTVLIRVLIISNLGLSTQAPASGGPSE